MKKLDFWNRQGWVRTSFFVVFSLVYYAVFHDYVLHQADQFLDDRHWGANPLFGLILFIAFLLETLALFFAVRQLSWLKYRQFESGEIQKSFLVRVNEALLGIGIYFHIIYAFFIELIIQNSTGSILGPITIIILLAREFYFLFKLWGVLYNEEKPKKEPLPLSRAQLNFVGLSLTITSVIFFNVSWDVVASKIGGSGFMAFFLAFVLYLPIRVFFVLDDYLALKDIKSRQYAILSSAFVIVFAVVTVVFGA